MTTSVQPDARASYAFSHDPQPIEDIIVTQSVLTTLSEVTSERNAKLRAGQSVREVNEGYVREFAHYLATISEQDERVMFRQVSASLATSGKDSSATLMQLVVAARVYTSLGIHPTTGVFGRGTAVTGAIAGAMT